MLDLLSRVKCNYTYTKVIKLKGDAAHKALLRKVTKIHTNGQSYHVSNNYIHI